MNKASRNIWWGPPRSINEKLHERKISWLELFYDLVYVAAVAQITGYLASYMSWAAVGNAFFIFALLFWSWLNGSNYHDLHGSTGIRTRLLTLWQMLAIAAVSITLPELFAGYHKPFAISFAVVQAIITYLWFSVGYYDKDHRKLNRNYTIFYSLALICIVASAFVDFTTAYILWGIAAILNYSVVVIAWPVTVREMAKRGLTYQTSASIVERLGLFTIIVLGENILGIIHGIAHVEQKTQEVWFAFLLGIVIIFLLWWIFFDITGDSEVKPGYGNFLSFNFIHLPLLGAFAISGAAIRVLMEQLGHHETPEIKLVFGYALVIILLCIALSTRIMVIEPEEKKVMGRLVLLIILTCVAITIITILSSFVNTITFLAIVNT